MKVLFTVWEVDPFIKIGGLGDVARSLPAALKKIDVDIRIMVPYYKVVKMGRHKKIKRGKVEVPFSGRKRVVTIWEVAHPYMNVSVYFLENTKYLDKITSMDTWGFFDKAVVEILKQNTLGWQPDIVHTNDSHCGFIPLLIKREKLPIKTMMTIHNLAYQNKTSIDVVRHAGIGPKECQEFAWETKEKRYNMLLEGIMHADIITTVSPTYAQEILSEEFGYGLNDFLIKKEGRIFGILNGIDMEKNNTTHAKEVKYHYAKSEEKSDGKIISYNWKEGKRLNKRLLQKKLGLKIDSDIPMLCYIGRIDAHQKGLDILHTMLRRIDQKDFEVVILGSGDEYWEERFRWFSTFFPKNFSCNFLFNNKLANQIYAAADFIIIPSRYEPCGLIQMLAMRFGTIPIAHNVGGLKDSIKDEENGFLFSKYNSEALEFKLRRALTIWKKDKTAFEKIVENAMTTDFSWNKSAQEYHSLYQKLLSSES